MPRYVVQRTFPEGLQIPGNWHGAEFCRGVVEHNTQEGVTWITSFVSKDRTRTSCCATWPPKADGACLRPLADLPGRFPAGEHAADSRRPAQAGESITHHHKSLRQ